MRSSTRLLAQRSTSGSNYFDNAGLSETDIALATADQAKTLTSIGFTASGGAGTSSWIMGISGQSIGSANTNYLADTSPVSIASGARSPCPATTRRSAL